MSDRISDILERAAGLIEPKGCWVQVGLPDPGQVPGATCAALALCNEGGPKYKDLALAALCEHLNLPNDQRAIWKWNDAPGRTQAEVVSTLREAAAKAREQGQ